MHNQRSLLDLKNSIHDLPRFFHQLTQEVSQLQKQAKADVSASGERVGLLFFEPSTRTRLSFESAAIRCGLGPLVFEAMSGGTSMEKGESIEDSILNIAAMDPVILVIRAGDEADLQKISSRLTMPVINAGWGLKGHPTQALLDTVLLQQKWQNLKGKKVAIVGDIRHSRVAASHFELLPTLGVQVGICGPESFLPKSIPDGVTVLEDLGKALAWADAVMFLRVQLERHQTDGAKTQSSAEMQNYQSKFGLGHAMMDRLRPDTILLHPGPVNVGVEISREAMNDPRSLILEQVRTGVYVREALLRYAMGSWN